VVTGGAVRARLGDHLDFSNGTGPPVRAAGGRYRVYGANGAIGYAAECNAGGPLIVLGRVGSYCGSVRYCEADVWVTDNAVVCRAKRPAETRYWYYALQTCGLHEYRSGSGQPLLNQRTLRDVAVWTVAAEDRRRISDLLGAFDDKIAANARVIGSAERLMCAIAESVERRVPLSALAVRATPARVAGESGHAVALYSLPAFDDGATPRLVDAASVSSAKLALRRPCVLVAKLNPRIARIWNVLRLPPETALASTEFVVLTPRGVDTSALWSAVRQPGVSETLRRRVAGTSGSHQRIQPHDLMEIRVPDVRRLPGEASATITALGELCHARRAENARLSALRDAALPPLIAGRGWGGDAANRPARSPR
jgi:Type I restriction modification DNA specificity domain